MAYNRLILLSAIGLVVIEAAHVDRINCNIQGNTVECFNLEIIPTPSYVDQIEKLIVRNSETLNISPDSFSYMSELKTLDLAGNRISYLPEASIENNKKLEVLILRDNNFVQIPSLVSTSLTQLDMSECFLENLTTDFINGVQNLKILKLIGNRWLKPQDILRIASLPSLHTIDTNIKSLDCNNKPDLPFDLSNTNFFQMCLGTCPTNCECEENRIICSNVNNISGPMQIIQKHTLFVNKKKDVISWPLPSSQKIHQVIIENGTLRQINEDAFAELGPLSYISLSNNKLIKLPRKFVTNQTNLTYIKLSHNLFTTIPDFVSKSLVFLDLDHCQISLVTGDFLKNLPSLQNLNLKYNNIKFVGNAFDGYRGHYISINLKFNPIQAIGNHYSLGQKIDKQFAVYQLDQQINSSSYKPSFFLVQLSLPLFLLLLYFINFS